MSPRPRLAPRLNGSLGMRLPHIQSHTPFLGLHLQFLTHLCSHARTRSWLNPRSKSSLEQQRKKVEKLESQLRELRERGPLETHWNPLKGSFRWVWLLCLK